MIELEFFLWYCNGAEARIRIIERHAEEFKGFFHRRRLVASWN